MQMSWAPAVLSGVGMRTSIFCTTSDGLKLDLRTTDRGQNGPGVYELKALIVQTWMIPDLMIWSSFKDS